MVCFINLFQPLLDYVRVDLRRRNIRVAQHHLHGAQICAALPGGESRKLCVSRDVRATRKPARRPYADKIFQTPRTCRSAPFTKRAGLFPALECRDCRASGESINRGKRLTADGDDTLFIALADAPHAAYRASSPRLAIRKHANRSNIALRRRANFKGSSSPAATAGAPLLFCSRRNPQAGNRECFSESSRLIVGSGPRPKSWVCAKRKKISARSPGAAPLTGCPVSVDTVKPRSPPGHRAARVPETSLAFAHESIKLH